MAMMPVSQDAQIAGLLTDYVDGIASLSALLRRYNLTYAQIADLVDLSDRLRAALVEVAPSEAFVENLYNDLVLHQQQAGRPWWYRVSLPPMSNRTKIAAGIDGKSGADDRSAVASEIRLSRKRPNAQLIESPPLPLLKVLAKIFCQGRNSAGECPPDDFIPAFRAEIRIDIRHCNPVGIEEPFKK